MFNIFLNDKSSFRTFTLLKALVALIFIVGSFVLSGMYNDTASEHIAKAKEMSQQEAWMKAFPFKQVVKINSQILKPAQQANVVSIAQGKVDLISSKGCQIINVDTTEIKPKSDAKNLLNFIQTTVEYECTWSQLQEILSEFEKDQLVVTTKLTGRAKGDAISVNMVFLTYFM